jgi:biopolymer transport protein ExbD
MGFGAGGGSPEEVKSEINVTPLVDVCLVLLIIFMVVTPMLQQGVDVLLPEGAHAEKKPGKQEDLIISVKSDGSVFVGQNWIPDKNLATYLRADAEFTSVAILTENQTGGGQMAQGRM